ncbi:MAG: YdeI/OmpD-associated family protein [Cyclobacteriaceae bacterium]
MADQETFCPKNRKDWRQWLAKNHKTRQSIWLVCRKASFGTPNITWDEAVDEALCFGWIDSTKKTLDEEYFIQYYSRRKPKSTWSKINKKKVEQLIADNLITPAGLECIRVAKENGAWTMLDSVDDLIVPEDLEDALANTSGAKAFYEGLSNSKKKQILVWILFAKQAETRARRINKVAEHAARGEMPQI